MPRQTSRLECSCPLGQSQSCKLLEPGIENVGMNQCDTV